MTRRRIALFGLVACVLLVAVTPWTVRSERVVTALARQITQSYGIALTSNGRLTLTLLPMPQFVLSGVRLVSQDGGIEVEADELRAQLRLFPLLQARLRLHKLWLARSSIAITLAEEPPVTVAGTLARLRHVVGAEQESRWVPRIDRFILTEADIGLRDRHGREVSRLKQASLILNSPEPDGNLDVTASAQWNGEAVVVSLSGVNLTAMRSGAAHDVEGEASGRLGRISLDGRLSWSDRPGFSGSVKGQTSSLARLARWSGLGRDFAPVDRPASISGDGTFDLDKLQWPRATIELGRDRLDGMLAVEFGDRPQVRATLAGDDIDLAWLGRIVEPAGLDRLGANYDVRLSASAATLGPLKVRDAALSVQCTPRGIEVSLGRATFAGGALRGRISAALESEDRDIRIVGFYEGIDLDRALVEPSATRTATGTASGQLSLDITGDRNESPLSQVRGRGVMQTRDGEFVLASFSDAAKRGQQPPADWRSGRVRFHQASLGFEFREGRAEIGSGVIETSATKAIVSGGVDLATRNAALRLSVQPTSPPAGSQPTILDLTGPLRRLTLGAITTSPAP